MARADTDDRGEEGEGSRELSIYKEAMESSSDIVQELGESRVGRPGLSVLTSLLVSVDVKNY